MRSSATVAQDLIPAAVDEAVAEHDLKPVATPQIRDVEVDDGKPLTFTALFETVPAIDPGDYTAFTLRQTPVAVDAGTVDQALERLRQGRAQLEPLTERAAERGDVLTIDIERRLPDRPGAAPEHLQGRTGRDRKRRESARVRRRAGRARGGRDALVHGDPRRERRRPQTRGPAGILCNRGEERAAAGAAGPWTTSSARSLGEFDDLASLRAQVEADLRAQAEAEARHEARQDLLQQLAKRVTVEVPEALIGRELDRRVERVARRLQEEQVDPRQARIDWDAFREQQRASATDTVRGTLVLDAIAGREAIEVTGGDVEQEVGRQAALSGRTPQAVRALLEKDGGLGRLEAGLRREKAIELLMKRATVVSL